MEQEVEALFTELLWVGPLLVGVFSVAYAAYSYWRRAKLSTIMTCFALSFLVVVLCGLGTWRLGLELWTLTGVAGDITAEMLFEGWKHSWRPIVIAGICSTFLLAIAIAARLRPPKVPVKHTEKDRQILMAIPPALITVIFAIVVILDLATDMSVTMGTTSPELYPLMALLLLAYYLFATVGIPYVILWGLLLYRWKKKEEVSRVWWLLATFHSLFAILTCLLSGSFYYAAWQGTNPLLP